MKPQKCKSYNIRHVPNKQLGEKTSYYVGIAECLSDFSYGGFYLFRLENGDSGMFSQEDIIEEQNNL
jgi:hypothetical protein